LKEKFKHMILDASAGTGKTYSIAEKTVERIKAGYDITNFVIMTFTEKAAGELKSRIRRRIKEEINCIENIGIIDNNKELDNLRNALVKYDYATICTIHGFCKGVLTEYAFECELPFKTDILNGFSSLRESYATNMLTNWRDYLDMFSPETVKELVDNDNKFKNIVEKISNEYTNKDVILPNISDYNKFLEFDDNIIEMVHEFFVRDLDYVLDIMKDNNVNDSNITKKLNILFDSYNKFKKDVRKFIISVGNLNLDLTSKQLEKLNKCGFTLDYQKLKEYSNTKYLEFKALMIKDTSLEFHNSNRKNMAFTFNELIETVAMCVSKDNSFLLKELRQRYKVGIIDEFQDTNSLQWEIIKRIFVDKLDDEDTCRHLIIVGDPKQSIYSFQGANVETYIKAKNELNNSDVEVEHLDCNYRSHKDLLICLNKIFSKQDLSDNFYWFSNEIGYNNLKTPTDKEKLNIDRKGNKPLVLFTIDIISEDSEVNPIGNISVSNKDEAKEIYAKYIKDEIVKLADCKEKLSDICVLVRNRSEFDVLGEIFNKFGIPYTFYKKTGLYNSNEANQLFLLLRAICYPKKINYLKDSLLTNFFEDINLFDLEDVENSNRYSKIDELFDKWRDINNTATFSEMMNSIFTDTKIFQRLLISENKLGDYTPFVPSSGERSISNYTQITRILNNYAVAGLTLEELIDKFKELREDATIDEAEESYEELDTEKDKVQIMTMHASKGLQFKYVFIYGGWSRALRSSDYIKYTTENNVIYDLNKTGTVIDGDKENNTKSIFENQTRDEIKRLLYVAFTRAEYKLYIPFVNSPKDDFVLAKEVFKGIDYNLLKDYIVSDYEEAFDTQFYNSNKEDGVISYNISPLKEISNHKNRAREVLSFSRLIKTGPYYLFEDVDNKGMLSQAENDDELDLTNAEVEFNEDTSLLLPKGTKTGLLLHEIFEKIDYSHIMSYNQFEDWLSDVTTSNHFLINEIYQRYFFNDDIYKNNVYKIVWNTLNTELVNNFKIGNIKNKYSELSFTMPYEYAINDGIVKKKQDYMTGIIDMVFQMNDKYYILDWKSNVSFTSFYNNEDINLIMDSHNYHMQYKIYINALKAWLRQNDIDENKIGGIYYIFLRKAEIDKTAAIFKKLYN